MTAPVATLTPRAAHAATEETARVVGELSLWLDVPQDPHATAGHFARWAVRRIVDVCLVHLLDDHAHVTTAVAAYREPVEPALARAFEALWSDIEVVPQVFRAGQPASLSDPPQIAAAVYAPVDRRLLRRMRVTSAVVVPLATGPTPFGTVSFVGVGARHPFVDRDLVTARALARCAALAIDYARLRQAILQAPGSGPLVGPASAGEAMNLLHSIQGWAHVLRTVTLDATTRARGLARLEHSTTVLMQMLGAAPPAAGSR